LYAKVTRHVVLHTSFESEACDGNPLLDPTWPGLSTHSWDSVPSPGVEMQMEMPTTRSWNLQILNGGWSSNVLLSQGYWSNSWIGFPERGVNIASGPREWQAESRVIVRDRDFPDDAPTSDHRPVSCQFRLPVRQTLQRNR
jgi:hypothetical protein